MNIEKLIEDAAKNICHDLHEGYVPGCGRLSLKNMEEARKYIAFLIKCSLTNENKQ